MFYRTVWLVDQIIVDNKSKFWYTLKKIGEQIGILYASSEFRDLSGSFNEREYFARAGRWYLLDADFLKQEESFVPRSFEIEITMWSDDGATNASPLEGEMYGTDKKTGKRQLYAFLFSRRFGRKYAQRLIELMDVEVVAS